MPFSFINSFLSFLDKRIFFLIVFSIFRAFVAGDFFVTKRLYVENQQFFISDPNFLVYSARIAIFLFLFCFFYFRGLLFGLPFFQTFLFKEEWKQISFTICFRGFLFFWSFLFSFEDLSKTLLFTTESFRNTWEFSYYFRNSRGNLKDVFLSISLIYIILFFYVFVLYINHLKHISNRRTDAFSFLLPSLEIQEIQEIYLRWFIRILILFFTFYYFLGESFSYDIFIFRGSFCFRELLLFSIGFFRKVQKFKTISKLIIN